MNSLISFIFASATLVALASAYGFKYNKNPYSGECKLQLNLPGVGQKEAFPGIMNTRYGSDDGKYQGNSASAASHSHIHGHKHASGHHGAGSSTKYASASNQHGNRYNPSAATGAGRYPTVGAAVAGGGNYAAGAAASNSNYGSASSSNYGAAASQNNYESGNYGSAAGGSYAPSVPVIPAYQPTIPVYQPIIPAYQPAAPAYQPAAPAYQPAAPPSGNRGTGSYGEDRDRETDNYGSSNYDRDTGNYASSNSRETDNYASSKNRETGNYGSSASNRDRDTGNYASSSNRDRDRYPEAGTGSYGASDYDRNTNDYGSSANRESSKFASAAGSSSNYGASSSANRGSSSNAYRPAAEDTDYDRYAPATSSSGNRGSGSSGSYGGGSSSDNIGESEYSSASSGSSNYAQQGDRNRVSGANSASYASTGSNLNDKNRRKSATASSASEAAYESNERYSSGERDTAYRPRPRPVPAAPAFGGAEEDYYEAKKEYSSSKSSSQSSSSKTSTKETRVIAAAAAALAALGREPINSNYDFDGQGSQNFEDIKAPTQFEECGVYEYYSKRFRKCVRIGSLEDEQLESEKKLEENFIKRKPAAVVTSAYAGPNGASSYAEKNGGGSGSISTYSNSAPGYSGSGTHVDDAGRKKSTHVGYSNSDRDSSSAGASLGFSSGGGGWNSLGGSQQKDYDDDYWDRTFANEVLSSHNSYRARHTTPPVTLDVKMSQKAQEWAAQLAAGVVYGHSPQAIEGEYGESVQLTSDSATGVDVVGKWYQEKYNYDFNDPILIKTPASRSNSHFTAVVWRGTKAIGVGKATANDGRTFVVVNYWPPGNIFDVLEDNVLPSRKDLPATREQFY